VVASPSLAPFANPNLPGTRQTPRLFKVFCCGPLLCAVQATTPTRSRVLLRFRTWCVCPVCVCTCKRGPVCHVALVSFEAVPIPQSAVSRPSPTSSTRPREVVALVCIRSCALQWFIKTLVWLEASTAAPSDTEKEARYSSL